MEKNGKLDANPALPALRIWGNKLKRKVSVAKRALLRLGSKGMVTVSKNSSGKTVVQLCSAYLDVLFLFFYIHRYALSKPDRFHSKDIIEHTPTWDEPIMFVIYINLTD